MSKSTIRYILRRLAISAVTLFVILVVLFCMVRFLPGSPINNEHLSEAQRAAIEASYGLDLPIPQQFVKYVSGMLTGDFGVSMNLYRDMQVSSLVATRAPISFFLGLSACILGTLVGILLGVVAALKKNTIWDTLATVLSVIGVSIPSFVFAMLILIIFGTNLHILPTMYSSSQPIYSAIMPILALSVSVIANVARFTRTEMISVLNSDYIMLAKAKGLSQKDIIFKHALRNTLIPIVTILGPILVNLMTGTMVVEKICSVPGLGLLLINSIQASDYNVILACSFLYAAMYIIMMLVIDVSYGIIDPRIRLGKDD